VRAGVLSYDPDYIDWGAGASMNRAGYCRNRGIPHAQPQQFEYDWGFAFTEDDPMQRFFSVNGVARNETGGTIITPSSEVTGGDANRMCHNAPLWQLVQSQGLARLAAYSDAVSCDDAGNGVATGQDYNYCDWCNKAFLNSSAARSLSLPVEFNIRDYLAVARAKNGSSPMALVQDPVLHAYSLSQYSAQADAWARTRQAVLRASAQLGRELTPLVYGNSWGLWGQSPGSTLISQRSDIIWAESCSLQDRVTDWHSLWTGRPAINAWSALMYKVGLASGDWQKPAWFFADDCNNPTMAELWQAEGVANGGLSVMLHIDAVLPGQPYNKSLGFSQANMRHAKFVTAAPNRFLCVYRHPPSL
jgi:hypothetical protein